jgi:hypothetical protein
MMIVIMKSVLILSDVMLSVIKLNFNAKVVMLLSFVM